jgi:leader peptidase (prepilin peptidase)/N-methyltransferase
VLGLAADRLATRWPEHDEEHPAGRLVDWRTAVVALVGALALGLLPLRFGGDPLALVMFGAWFVTLTVGLATDLDQRLLPDLLTLPVIPVALVYALSGANPLVGGEVVLAVVAAVAIPAVLYLPSIPFGAGAFGLGDVKLLVGVVIAALLLTRRIGRRTYVPFGPFFIIGALWAVLLRA